MSKILIANWKMNTSLDEAIDLADFYKAHLKKTKNIKLIICPPSIWMNELSKKFKNTSISLGAQNIHYKEKGAFTGEISASMVREYARYVIVGHSERRIIFSENNEAINQKIKICLKNKLVPILCFGEVKKEEGIDHILAQISLAVEHINIDDISKILFAYEPVWAIGTGNVATSNHARAIIESCRERLAVIYNREIAQKAKFLYGGSVNSKNINSFINEENLSGFLVGGASLDRENFERIYNNIINNS